jgi:hypothetical protein
LRKDRTSCGHAGAIRNVHKGIIFDRPRTTLGGSDCRFPSTFLLATRCERFCDRGIILDWPNCQRTTQTELDGAVGELSAIPKLSLLLQRHFASFEESSQVVPSPFWPRQLSDIVSENLSLDAGSRTPAARCVHLPVSLQCHRPSPRKDRIGFPLHPARRLLAGIYFEVAVIL